MSNQATQPNTATATIEGRNSIGGFLKLFRVSNTPTIITNTFVGASVAALMEPGSFPHITNVIVVSIGLVFIYIAGMTTNDYFDQVIDARERPTRPIPSRQISSGTALLVGVLFLLVGMTACAFVSIDALPWVMLLSSTVLAYNILHLARFMGPLLMGMCRALGLVVATIALSPSHAPDWPILLFFALALGVCTFGISLVARNEMERKDSAGEIIQTQKTGRTMIATALIGVGAIAPLGAIAMRLIDPMSNSIILIYVVSITLACFTFFRGLTFITHPRAAHIGVMHWIAALSLLDAASLCILNQPILAYSAIGCFILTSMLQRRIAGS